MNKINYIINWRDGKPVSLTSIVQGRPIVLPAGNENFSMVVKELKKEKPDAEKVLRLLQKNQALAAFSKAQVVERNGKFYFQGVEIQNVLVERIREFMRLGLPFKPQRRFLDNLMKNPSERSRNTLYNFLENEGLTTTADGCFLGYKGARSDFWSIMTGRHTMLSGKQSEEGRIFYGKGEKVRIPWNEVVDDPNTDCARGLHVGSFNYANGYAGQDGNLVLVKVNPADVVSVTHSCKEVMRVCAFEVVEVLSVRKAVTQAFEPQFVEATDEDATTYHNVRDSKGRFSARS